LIPGEPIEAGTDPVVASLELAAGRCSDIVPLVYERLFAARPDLRSLFAVQVGAAPRSGMGNMVNEVLRLVLADDAMALAAEAQAAVVFHVGWGLDVDMYRDVVDSVMTAVRDACGEAWTPRMQTGWQSRFADVLEALRRQHESIEGPAHA
jgi:hemoglobin-like flavoprotein